jgi:antitoxin HicB
LHDKLPLVFEPQPEGGYTVTSPALPELLTEGDSFEDALENVRDAMAAVLEIDRDLRKSLPSDLAVVEIGKPLHVDLVVAVP